MFYLFTCLEHGEFETIQSMDEDHMAICPQCGIMAQRKFSTHEVIWGNTAYRSDGSRREDKDYAILKG